MKFSHINARKKTLKSIGVEDMPAVLDDKILRGITITKSLKNGILLFQTLPREPKCVYMHIHLHMYIYICVCVCVRVQKDTYIERKNEREGEILNGVTL